ncbi:MAG TPA: zinc metalloprotease [Methyloceanibacter sp.]|nr:zinc metalloprotease [Methyloceanibacter sp.]
MNRRNFLMSSACACLATATAKIGSLLAQDAPPVPKIRYRCGTPLPTPSEQIQSRRVVAALRAHRVVFRGTTTVPIRFHIIHEGDQGYLPDRQLKAQVELLNRVYEPASVVFEIVDVNLHENSAWFRHEPGSEQEIEMKTELGKEPTRSLNIYTAEPGNGLLGYATFPWWLKDTPQLDGVVLHHASLPEASRPWVDQPWPFDLGMTAVHEIGHWCGLYHTFQNGCQPPGDDVDDTAFEARPAAGCPLNQPSDCEGETRFNPVQNYMDYSDDSCMKEFTPIQYQRIKDMLGYHRPELNPLTRRSALLEQIRKSIE